MQTTAASMGSYGTPRLKTELESRTMSPSWRLVIALPLRAVKLYQEFKGVVMPHELLAAIKQHLASDDTSLDNGDDWGLVQK